MKRKDFLKKFGIGIGVIAVAPTVISAVVKEPEQRLVIFKDGGGEYDWKEEYQRVWYHNAHWTDAELKVLKTTKRPTFDSLIELGVKRG